MTDELYDLYKRDSDFKHYCDEWCRNHKLEKEQVFEFNILKEYAKYLREGSNERDRAQNNGQTN